MGKFRGRRRLTCHHEGGHALVRWYFGHATDRAVVQTFEDAQAGKTIANRRGIERRCEGAVDGYGIHDPPYVPYPFQGDPETAEVIQRHARVCRDVELINVAAGLAAEGAYRRVSGFVCAIEGGDGDLKQQRAILEAWYSGESERREAAFLAERRAAALIRSSAGSIAIGCMAEALMARGEIDGDEIFAICRKAYGGRQCEFGAWEKQWPPTLKQLRAGFIPPVSDNVDRSIPTRAIETKNG